MQAQLGRPEVLARLAGRREREQPVWLVCSDRGGHSVEWVDLGASNGTEVAVLPLSAVSREPGDGRLVFMDETSGDVVEVSGEVGLADDAIRFALRSAIATPAAEHVWPEFFYDVLPLPETTHIGDKAALRALGRRFCTAVLWPAECTLDEAARQFCFPIWELREDIRRGAGEDREVAGIRWDLTLDNVTSATVKPGPTPHAYEFFTGVEYRPRQRIVRHRPWGLSLARLPLIELHIEALSGTFVTSGVPTWRWDWTDRLAASLARPSP